MNLKSTWTATAAVVVTALAFAAPSHAAEGIEVRPDLAPGDLVQDGAVSLIVPPAGTFAWVDADAASEVDAGDAHTESLGALTQADGTVILADVGQDVDSAGSVASPSSPLQVDPLVDALGPDAAGNETAAASSSPAACDDGAYKLAKWTFSDGSIRPYKWKSTYNWLFKAGSVPSGVSTSNARDAVQRAAANIGGSQNNCGLADEVSATQSFAGDTTTGTDINATGTICQSYQDKDGKSVVAYGTLPAKWLAVACTWGTWDGAVAKATQGDVKMNKSTYSWYGIKPSNCSTRWSTEGVMTHEFGHTFGLGHVTEADHGNLTMSKAINGACQESERSLGLGDVRGLRDLY